MKQQINTLYQCFHHLNKTKFNHSLQEPIITIQTKGKHKAFGWCSILPIWFKSESEDKFYEINLAAEYINRSFEDIIETLLHEMVHLANIQNGITDCSKSQNHNEFFKNEAERVGLICTKVKKYGWGETSLSDELETEINSWDFVDKNIFNIARIENVKEKDITKQNQKVKWVCPSCHTDVRASEEASIMCMNCGVPFERK